MGEVEQRKTTKAEIANELYAALEKLGARSDLLEIVGSYGETQDDQWVLDNLHRWNSEEP